MERVGRDHPKRAAAPRHDAGRRTRRSAGRPHARLRFARYSWTIADAAGKPLLHGIDVVERADDQRLERVVMFFGDLLSED